MTPADYYHAHPEFAAIVDRVAAECGESVEAILSAMEPDSATWTTSALTAEDLQRELQRELQRQTVPTASAVDHRLGARRPGYKPTPPLPPWAHGRKSTTGRPGR